MTIRIITVGKKPASELASLIAKYEKRLPTHIHVEWIYVKHGTSMQAEAEQILRNVPDGYTLIALDEHGKLLDSPQLAESLFQEAVDVCFVIGGAEGLDASVTTKSSLILSLSKLVFPHQLVRLLLAEQIYRAWSIHTGHPYHNS